MFPYIAFKSLVKSGDTLLSPLCYARWNVSKTPWGDYHVGWSRAGDLQAGFGIHAAGIAEARNHVVSSAEKLYLVIPYPGRDMVLAEDGWRAEGAIALRRFTSPLEAANLVVSSMRAGYAQVEGVAGWAGYVILRQTGDAGALIESGNGRWLYRAALDSPTCPPRILAALAGVGDAEWLAKGIVHLPAKHARNPLVEALLRSGDAEWIAYAVCNASDARYDKRLALALINTLSAKWISYAKTRRVGAKRIMEVCDAK